MRYRIDSGGHTNKPGACVMEWVSLLWGQQIGLVGGQMHVDWFGVREKTDTPGCTHPMISNVAIMINDSTRQEHRDRLAALLPRLLRASAPKEESAVAVLRRLRVWLVRRRLEQLARVDDRPSPRGLELLKLLEEGGGHREAEKVVRALRAEYENRHASWSEADALLYTLVPPTLRAGEMNYLGHDVDAARDLIESTPQEERAELLGDLLTALEKAKAEEGVLGEDPEEFYLTEEQLDAVVRELGGEQEDA